MPPPDRAHGAWISKIGSKVKHVGIVDRKMAQVPWRPICNQHANTDEIRMVGTRGGSATNLVWWVDLNPTAWSGRKVCGNCIRVIDELNQMLTGDDTDREELSVSDVLEGDGGFIFPPSGNDS